MDDPGRAKMTGRLLAVTGLLSLLSLLAVIQSCRSAAGVGSAGGDMVSAPSASTGRGDEASGVGLQARIALDAARREAPIPRGLFGKFTEHLGSNVYQGAWAQVVVNPEFAPASRWASKDALRQRLTRYETVVRMPGLASAAPSRFAPYWLPVGDVAGELLTVDGRDAQQVSAKAEGAELRTGVFLPVQRVRTCELTIKARVASPGSPKTPLRLALLTDTGQPLAETKVVLTDTWREHEASLTVPRKAEVEPGQPLLLSLGLPPQATVQLSRVLLFPADHQHGWDPEVVEYMKQARLPLLRFPGGNFASTYHWKDGIGPLDGRPVRPNTAWPDIIEFNHVGTDEWLKLCELVGAEPLICINAGSGTPQEARDWVAYCNAPAKAPMGKLRAANGHTRPYNVRLWEVGNELYGDWQEGHTDAAGYAERYVRFCDAMLSVGGTELQLIANGCDERWNDVLVKRAGAKVRSVSAHYLVGGGLPGNLDPAEVFRQFMAFSATFGQQIDACTRPMAKAGLKPRMALTELQTFTHQPRLPNNETLAEALWVADITNACIQDGRVEMITHSALVNHGGGLRKHRGVVWANPVWWVTHLYASQKGVIPVGIQIECPTYSVPERWFCGKATVGCLGAVALLSTSADALALFVVNRDPGQALVTEIRVEGFRAAASAEVITLAGKSFMDVNTFEAPTSVHPVASTASVSNGTIRHTFAPASLTRIVLKRGRAR